MVPAVLAHFHLRLHAVPRRPAEESGASDMKPS